jgi:hypothetical protein
MYGCIQRVTNVCAATYGVMNRSHIQYVCMYVICKETKMEINY